MNYYEVDVRFEGTEEEYLRFREWIEAAGGTVMQSLIVND